MFVVEKSTHDKIEDYVLDISKTNKKKLIEENKRNPKEETMKYSAMKFQAQNENLRAVCFSPDKKKDLHILKLKMLAVLYQT